MKIVIAQQLTHIKTENEEKIGELRTYFDFLKSEINRIDDELRSIRLKMHTGRKNEVMAHNTVTIVDGSTKVCDKEYTSGTDFGTYNELASTNPNKLQKEVRELSKSLNNINLDDLNKSAVELGVANVKEDYDYDTARLNGDFYISEKYDRFEKYDTKYETKYETRSEKNAPERSEKKEKKRKKR
jgi:hypothetical protein